MKSRVARSTAAKSLPVFVFPEELNFIAKDQRTHKRLLTIYNPYNFEINFQVLCNTPERYAVTNPHGTVKAHCCVDIVIKHKCAHSGPYNTSSKFKVEAYHGDKLLGSKVVASHLKDETNLPEPTSESLEFTRFSISSEHPSISIARSSTATTTAGHSVGVLPVIVTVVCLVLLFLPLEEDVFTSFPPYIRVSVNMKILAAYILGIMTILFVKT
ncbi:motile sperm domain-containing protein 1-like [Dysidea avara]|uniref:motile sperm domain-containing protein 1-like n=1 Tax=Dysidea avara TaxID=196820 RepID=UPI00332D4F70